MRVLITGASGFIGGRIAEDFLRSPELSLVVAARTRPKHALFPLDKVELRLGELTDPDFANAAVRGCDVIVHAAGMAGDWGPYSAFREANVLVTQNLLAAARAHGVKRFINISSPSIYFEFRDQLNLNEEHLPRRFSNHYARTKHEAEKLVSAAHSTELATVSLRPRFVIGRGDNNILPRLLRLQKEGTLVQVGTGENVVSVTHVANVVHAVRICLTAPVSALGTVYNIADAEPVRLWDFIDEVLRECGLPTARKRFPRAPLLCLARLSELVGKILRRKEPPALLPIPVAVLSQSMTLNTERARTRLGYQPVKATQEGIREFAFWWKTEGNGS